MYVTNIPGDSFRHDKIKTELNRLCLASGIRAECEVFGAFKKKRVFREDVTDRVYSQIS